MTPVLPQPDPLPLAAPPLVFWLLLMLTFTLHVLLMNAVLGGSIIGAAARWIGARGSANGAERAAKGERSEVSLAGCRGPRHSGDDHGRLARLIGRAMPVAIAAAVSFGVAALLFLQVLYGRAFFPSSVLMAWIWLAIVPLLIAAYYAAYALGAPKAVAPNVLSIGMAAIFVVIAFIYSNNMGLMLRVDALPGLFARDARGLQLNTADPTMLPRYLHMVLGAIAVAGLMVCAAGVLMRSRDQAFGAWAMRWGAGWFGIATALNLPAGIWWLGVLPSDIVARLMGGDAAATVVLASGIAAALAAIGLLFVGTHAARPGPWVFGAAGALLASLVLMLLTRDFIRQQALDAAGFTAPALVAPQWGVMAIFLVLLVAAVGAVGWMARQLAVAQRV